MLVLNVPEEQRGPHSLDLGDWITKINDEPISSKKEYTLKLRKFGKPNADGKVEASLDLFKQ